MTLDPQRDSAAQTRTPPLPLRIFASPRLPLSPQEVQGLERIASLPDVVQVVALPDLHIKPQLETPSSTVTATRRSIILSLSSPSPGCGMALALTPLFAEPGFENKGAAGAGRFSSGDMREDRLDEFFAQLAQRLPLGRDGHSSRLVGTSAAERSSTERSSVEPRSVDLPSVEHSSEDIRPVLLDGAASAVQRFDLDPALLGCIERRGNALASLPVEFQPITAEQVLETIPPQFLPLAGREFGAIGAGNHFFELQVVEEILDAPVASRWGIQTGQVAALYHADSGRLGALLGRWYAHRRKNNWRGRWLELRYKTTFHFSQAGSLQELARRANSYFAPRRHTALLASSPLARQALLALGAAANYAYANRVAILAALRDSLQAVWGRDLAQPNLLYDVSHNSIRQEQGLWVHRHNASQALPPGHPDLQATPFEETGQPVLLPGTHRTCSYLCVAGLETGSSLYSVDHGAGRSALRLGQESPGVSGATRVYDYQHGYLGDHSQLSDDGIDEVLAILSQAGLARPVARLRPLGVLKDRPN